jgi:signal transduction histidine kinase
MAETPPPESRMESPGRAPARTRVVPLFLTLIFLATELVLLVNAGAFVLSTRDAVARADRAAGRVEVLDRLQVLRTTLYQAESAARGYALTGEPAFLGIHRAAAESLTRTIEQVAPRLGDGSGQDPDLASLRALVADEVAAMNGIVDARRAGTSEAAARLLANGPAAELAGRIDRALAALESREAAAIAERRESARRAGRATIAAALLVTLLAMIVIALFYRRMERHLREQQAAAADLRATNDSLNLLVAARTAQLTHLSQHLISAAEEEKAAFARELHDALGSNLTAVDIDVKWVEKKLRDGQPELADRLRRALGVLEHTVEIKRNVIEALRPSLLDMLGLATALESLSEEFTRRTGIDVVPDLDQELPDLPPDVSIALYRVVQEALANVEKHAQASVVRVALHRAEEHLRLVIEDDGIGIPEDALGRAASHGLVGMRERLRALGGTFEVRRGPHGRGTIIEAVAPRPV